MNKDYELVVILDTEVSADGQEKLLAKIKKIITEAEGKVSEVKQWGKKELAYPIKKRKMGDYYLLEIILPAEKVSVLGPKFLLEEGIIRFLMVNKLKQKEAALK